MNEAISLNPKKRVEGQKVTPTAVPENRVNPNSTIQAASFEARKRVDQWKDNQDRISVDTEWSKNTHEPSKGRTRPS